MPQHAAGAAAATVRRDRHQPEATIASQDADQHEHSGDPIARAATVTTLAGLLARTLGEITRLVAADSSTGS
jgi:hypothetical protein